LNTLLKIFSAFETKRQTFVFDLVFKQLLGTDYEIVFNQDPAHIIYDNSYQSRSVNIPVCSDLLNSKGFEPIGVSYKNTGADTILFPLENPQYNLWNFDLFSAIFYLVSRYEEYKGFEPDAHLRFPPGASILHKTQSFEFPLVNIWVQKLKLQLQAKFPELIFKEPAFKFISTIDVDSTFQYKEKDFFWSLSGILKDLFKGNFGELYSRIWTVFNLKPDAFDVFEKLDKLHKKIQVIYFWLLGNYSKFDKNINWKNLKQQSIIKQLAQKHQVGIHPSYQSNNELGLLNKEINRLETILRNKPTMSRQHFLIHQFPKTYQNLIKHGIKQDYTLGYTSQYGFRAGIASPFYFYDLEQDECTNLLLFPFCSMDITPLHYYKLTTEQAIEKNLQLLKRVKEFNGTFISLWHNESISGTGRWRGDWPKVYEQLLKDATNLES